MSYLNQTMVTRIKEGHSRVAPGRIAVLADAIEVGRVPLLDLALTQVGLETVRGVLPTEHEGQWLEVLRDPSGGSDPPVSKRGRPGDLRRVSAMSNLTARRCRRFM